MCNAIERAYENAQSFQDLCRINEQFLRGDYAYTAYHGGPIFDETIPLLDKLRLLNAMDCYTFNGQPPSIGARGYLSFFIEYKHINNLLCRLNGIDDICYVVECDASFEQHSLPVQKGEAFPLHRGDCAPITCIRAGIGQREDMVHVHLLNGVDECIFQDVALVTLANKTFDSDVSLEDFMLLYLQSN